MAIPNRALTTNVSLYELTATSHGDLLETNRQEALVVIKQLELLAANMQVVRKILVADLGGRFGGIHFINGFRGPVLNSRVNGSKTSQHMDGDAADWQPITRAGQKEITVAECFSLLLAAGRAKKVAWGQLLLEYGRRENSSTDDWIHFSNGSGSRDFPQARWGEFGTKPAGALKPTIEGRVT